MPHRHVRTRIALVGVWLCTTGAAAAGRGQLELSVIDSQTKEPVAVRVHLRNSRGRAVKVPAAVNWHDHFVFDGTIVLELPVGTYTFEMERGPEYRTRTGHFVIKQGAADNKQVEMYRFVNMSEEGWWSGDLHVERKPSDNLPLQLLAEDLHVASIVGWTSQGTVARSAEARKQNPQHVGTMRCMHTMTGVDRYAGGTVFYHGLDKQIVFKRKHDEYPAPFQLARLARQQGNVKISMGQSTDWDLPTWLASDKLGSVCVLHAGLTRTGPDQNLIGRPADAVLYPAPYGAGRWAMDVYFRVLDAGLRIPPVAGSGSGKLDNPLGYNRVYVYCGDQFNYENWWHNLLAGRVIISNGPLLRVFANGQPPGHVFRPTTSGQVSLELDVRLSTREKIEYLEIIKNGRSVRQIRLDQWATRGGKIDPIDFTESGWLIVRVMTNNKESFRAACSGPFFVQIDDQPRISKQAAQFFLDWQQQRAGRIRIKDKRRQQEVVRFHRAARDFWQRRVDRANLD